MHASWTCSGVRVSCMHPGAASAALRGSFDAVHPPSHAALIAHARACVSALLSVGLAMMTPARRDIGCSRAGAARLPPPRRYPDRSHACAHMGAAQRGLDFDGAGVARYRLIAGFGCSASPCLDRSRVCVRVLARLRHELYFDGAGLCWRGVSCFGGRVLLRCGPCHRYPDRSRACVRISAAQLEPGHGGASVARHQLLWGVGYSALPCLDRSRACVRIGAAPP